MKNLFAILLIIGSIAITMVYIRPTWDEIQTLRADETKYSDALKRVDTLSAALENQKTLIANIPAEDLEDLEKLLPDNVDNVQLIIDINNIAASEGLTIRDIAIATPEDETNSRTSSAQVSRAGYDSIDLSFSVTSPYPQFINFISSLEQSLRLVDVTAVSFVPTDTGSYNFSVTLRTYWLK
jgi:Tfp pilus assembly protein PilO